MHRLLLLFFVLLASAGISSGPAAANDIKACATTGDAAIAACTRVISSGKMKGQNLVVIYANRGARLVDKGEYDRGLADLNESLRLNPRYAFAYNSRGAVYVNKGEYDRGIEDLSEAIRLDPKNAFAWGNRGFAYASKQDYDRALSDLNESIRIDPKHVPAYANRGFVYNAKRDHDRAIRDLDEAIRLNPKYTAAYVNRSFSYNEKGEQDRAIADANEAIRLDPKFANAYGNRGLAYSAKGDFGRAIQDLDELVRLNPKSADAYVNRGAVHGSKADHDRAIADYSDAIRLNPKHLNAYNNRAFSYNAKSQHDRAIADADEATRIDPKYPNPYRHRGTAYIGKGDIDRAIAEYDQAIRLNPKYPEAYLSRSIAREKKGDLDGAYRDAIEAFALKPAGAEMQKRRDELRSALSVSQPPAARPTPAPAVAAVSPQQSSPAAPATTAAASGPRVALVIGNGNYRHSTRLPNPANDAADMSQTLRRLGFDVVEGRDLDKRGMEDKVREFGRKLDNAGLALFFYAGHGLQVGGKNYLVPVDAKLERAGDLNFDAVDVGNVLAQMEAERRVNLVFLDACRDNPLARSFARSLGTRSTAVGQGLATIQSAIGTMIAYATQPDAVALDGDGRNSPFTTALLKHMSTPGVDIGTLMRRVRADVITATREKQVPWDHSSLIGEVILAR